MNSPLYLLDTNILSDLIKHPDGVVMRKIAAIGEDAICTSIVVACELRFGAEKKQPSILSAKVEQLLSHIDVVPLDVDSDLQYALLRADLQKSGKIIGPNDMLIAAHARSLGLVVVTDNEGEFSSVPELRVENWLADT